ncbi:MAG TPA: peptidase, partial [Candidatus Omnitrophota bacterium]|nr:peptidase [Candidatus Omnitrophota bacterium]
MIGAGAASLPPLRDDLGLIPGPEARDGTPTWTIHDPVRNRYFRIGHAAFELLARWHMGDPGRVLAEVRAEAGLALGQDAVEWMVRFLDGNHLLRRDGTAGIERLEATIAAGKVSWHSWLLHNYLFFRIPLVRPDHFLAATLSWVRPFYTRGFLYAALFAWIAGLMLVVRQWDVFLATIPEFFT